MLSILIFIFIVSIGLHEPAVHRLPLQSRLPGDRDFHHDESSGNVLIQNLNSMDVDVVSDMLVLDEFIDQSIQSINQ